MEYISYEKFSKLTKKEKLEIPTQNSFEEVEIDKLVLIQLREKNDGWNLGAFFAHTPNKGWWRPMTYDCWQIVTDLQNPIIPKYQILKGDFQHDGIQIFGFVDEHCKAFLGYGGQITIKKKIK